MDLWVTPPVPHWDDQAKSPGKEEKVNLSYNRTVRFATRKSDLSKISLRSRKARLYGLRDGPGLYGK
jgi:hypothetical protein